MILPSISGFARMKLYILQVHLQSIKMWYIDYKAVLSFSPPQRGLAPHGGHFDQDAPQMPSLISLGPPSKLFISVFIKNFK